MLKKTRASISDASSDARPHMATYNYSYSYDNYSYSYDSGSYTYASESYSYDTPEIHTLQSDLTPLPGAPPLPSKARLPSATSSKWAIPSARSRAETGD